MACLTVTALDPIVVLMTFAKSLAPTPQVIRKHKITAARRYTIE
ncbi:hypothetical protein [Legionella sainthelensi]|nr:hypothetical protein [Legionella sainthelensi]